MLPQGCLPFVLFIVFLLVLPVFLAEVMLAAMGRLGLSPTVSIIAALGIFAGGLVNIPVQKIPRNRIMTPDPIGYFGMNRLFGSQPGQRDFTIIAVNLGGCVVPCLLAAYQMVRIFSHSPQAVAVVLGATAINVYICYRLAQPVARVGITLPAFIPPLVAALSAIVFMPDFAPPVAFCAGVLGPLIGADLLHMNDIKQIDTSVASIGGAGTFDGIVISGLLATLLV